MLKFLPSQPEKTFAQSGGGEPWPMVRLGDYASKIGSGSTPRGGEAVYVRTGVPLIRSMNVHFDGLRPEGLAYITKEDAEKLKNVIVQERDVLLNITGASIGRVTTVPGELVGARVNQHVCIIRPTSGLLPKFLAYFFASPVEQMRINDCQVGATRQALTKQMIEDWQVPLPPLEEQQQIVAEIEKQFTRLEVGLGALRRLQANLKRYRAAVLKAACEGTLAEDDKTKWKTERLGQLVTIRYGKMLPTKEFSDSGFPVFGANGIIGHHTRYLYETEQVLISCRGAYSGKINLSPPRCYITNNSLVLEIPKCSRVDKRFLFYMLQAADKSKLVTGSAQPQVTINNADVLEVPVPPLAEQTLVVAEVERRLSLVEELEVVVSINLQRAKRLRGSILAVGFRSDKPAEHRPPKAKGTPALTRQPVKIIRPITSPMKKHLNLTPESLVETVRRNKGIMTPSDLCLALNVEEEVEGFFEALRDCRDRGLLAVPSGIRAIIKLAKS